MLAHNSKLQSVFAGLAVVLLALSIGTAVRAGVWDKPRIEPYRLPVARSLLSRSAITRPHHDHPAWDFFTPIGTKVYAVQAGRVVAALRSGACGTGVVIDGNDGYRYTYCHGSKTLVGGGSRVHSGDSIMLSGSSGSSTRAHLHLEVEDRSLRLKCPQPMLLSWWMGGQMTAAAAPSKGCTY
jgi:Peptidase family M23